MMTQEDKELLLKDLCSRLPYGVICTDNKHGDSVVNTIDINPSSKEITIYYWDFDEYGNIEYCKPYLRPMSSMTEEEENEYNMAIDKDIEPERIVDWLNARHFDYRGLIERELALEAPDGMYNLKEV